jgi:ABC-type transporter Mla subunit MlaD
MPDDARSHDPFADVINMLAAPIAGGLRSVEQFKRGVEEMFRAVDNLNRTMENLNEAAGRINNFLAAIEEPVNAMIPQITRTVKKADELTTLLEAPIRATAPNIERIVTTFGSPAFTAVPQQLGELLSRLGPLAQLAENAGGLFGGLRIPGMSRPAPGSAPVAATPAAPVGSVRSKPAEGTTTAKQSSAKQSSAKRSSATRTSGNKPATGQRSKRS